MIFFCLHFQVNFVVYGLFAVDCLQRSRRVDRKMGNLGKRKSNQLGGAILGRRKATLLMQLASMKIHENEPISRAGNLISQRVNAIRQPFFLRERE